VKRIFFSTILVLSLAAVPSAPAVELRDPGFEEAGADGGLSPAWHPFGNAYREKLTPRSGEYTLKLFGNFNGEMNWSGAYQDLPVQAGLRYQAEAWVRHNCNDALQGGNTAFVKLEFFDSAGNLIKEFESPRLAADRDCDKYFHLSTGLHQAPDGAARVRVTLIFEQPGNDPGAAIFDDVELTEKH